MWCKNRDPLSEARVAHQDVPPRACAPRRRGHDRGPLETRGRNVAVPLELNGLDDAWDRAAAELKAVGLGDRVHHYPGQLSGGEQQRVALARALGPRPQILFADEPTGNLDSANGEAIADLLFALNAERGATLFLVTHEDSLARRCQRVVRLESGRIVADELAGVPA